MARKRSLRDVAAEQLIEKDTSVAEKVTPVIEAVKKPNAGRKKKAAARKRSLKDAAADQLVEKNKVVPEDPVTAIETPLPEPVAAAEPKSGFKTLDHARGQGADRFESGATSIGCEDFERPATPPLFNEPSAVIESPKKGHPSLKWVGILLLIGFAAGFFFGVGRAIGPANAAFILFGFGGGYLFGQFYKIF